MKFEVVDLAAPDKKPRRSFNDTLAAVLLFLLVLTGIAISWIVTLIILGGLVGALVHIWRWAL